MESIVTAAEVVVLSIEMLFVVIQDHLDIYWMADFEREAQYSKIRQKNSWNHIALALYTIEFFNGTCRSKNVKNTSIF